MMAQALRPVMLVVLDGFGWREEDADNAVRLAHKPAFDRLWATCPHAFLRASGTAVGLPEGQMGNSEVGHLNIGAGRVVVQELPRIGQAIKAGELAAIPELRHLIETMRRADGTCHLLGLVSPGGVHSHQDHAAALAQLLHEAGVRTVVHAFTDGRDTPPRSGGDDLARLAQALPEGVPIATVSGRYYAMDRDRRWERVSRAYHALAEGEGEVFPTPAAAIEHAYALDVTDEFVVPTVIGDYKGMQDGDGLLCFNFRADRVREILAALLDVEFKGFKRSRFVRFAAAAGMTAYGSELDAFMDALFPPESLLGLLGEVAATAGRAQLRAAETEKYPHVTYFLNGGREAPFDGEDRIMV
ncbi:MAG: 2,3-bisphosphoglycerate-independent phosphoglycerate mutase, partial [Pseudomonadota bacterium]|nr:2,3-bisphosphoglycerate-independent phosphoglycerate mutase [Pseudomonadota bacterium]